MSSRFVAAFCGLLTIALFPALAAALSPQELAQKLQARYEETKTMSADFKQTTTLPSTSRKRLGNGRLVIAKPGRIRWDYQTPEKQVLVSDGNKFLMYLPSSRQMMVQPVSQYLNSDVTYAFFTGSGNIVRDFNALPPDRPVGQREKVVKLAPKAQHPQVAHLHVWLDDSFMISRLEIVDHFGSVTDLAFSNLKRNEPVSPELFRFTPPPGTEIIEQ